MNGKIYKLFNINDPEKCYIGSTRQKYLCNRKAIHKYHNKIERKNGLLKELFNLGNVEIELIEEFENISNEDLLKRENYFINQQGFYNINLASSIYTKKEYNDKWRSNPDNYKRLLESNNKYRLKNIETLMEKKKEKITCSCGAVVSRGHLSRHTKSQKHTKKK